VSAHAGRPTAARAGFTLLEVMVALALLAASFMALAELAGQALRNHAAARDVSAATLLARGKLAELEEKYEDQGFKDFDEEDEGDFTEEGRPDVRWKVELVRPDPQLSADQLVGLFGGGEGQDVQGLLGSLMGTAAQGAAAGGPRPDQGAATAVAGQLVQTQLTAFGEKLKKAFRELRLTVSWLDGRAPRSLTVTTHLVVLNPKAPGGARGDSPDVPPNLAAAPAGRAGLGGLPGTTGTKAVAPTGAPAAGGAR
jgi:general secretion pathway protein I